MADKAVFSNGNNHSFNTAQELHINEIVYGNMTSVNIDDYYKINFSGSGQMQFLLKISDDTRYNMYIYEEGNLTTHIAHMGGNAGNDRSITRLVENKTYYIKIYAYDANSINHNTSGYDYNLQFVPTIAEAFTFNLSRNFIRDTESSVASFTPTNSNAYVDISYTTDNDYISINNNVITAIKSCNAQISAFDDVSKRTGSGSIKAAVRLDSKYRINQWSSVWQNTVFGNNSEGEDITIGNAGCGICCLAMGLLYEDFNTVVTDNDKNSAINTIISAGFHNSAGLLYSGAQERTVSYNSASYKIAITPMSDFTESADAGDLTMVRIYFAYTLANGTTTYTSHFVLIDGIDPTYKNSTSGTNLLRKYLVVDPRDGLSRSLYDAIQNKLTRCNKSGTPSISHLDASWTRKLTVTKL